MISSNAKEIRAGESKIDWRSVLTKPDGTTSIPLDVANFSRISNVIALTPLQMSDKWRVALDTVERHSVKIGTSGNTMLRCDRLAVQARAELASDGRMLQDMSYVLPEALMKHDTPTRLEIAANGSVSTTQLDANVISHKDDIAALLCMKNNAIVKQERIDAAKAVRRARFAVSVRIGVVLGIDEMSRLPIVHYLEKRVQLSSYRALLGALEAEAAEVGIEHNVAKEDDEAKVAQYFRREWIVCRPTALEAMPAHAHDIDVVDGQIRLRARKVTRDKTTKAAEVVQSAGVFNDRRLNTARIEVSFVLVAGVVGGILAMILIMLLN